MIAFLYKFVFLKIISSDQSKYPLPSGDSAIVISKSFKNITSLQFPHLQ